MLRQQHAGGAWIWEGSWSLQQPSLFVQSIGAAMQLSPCLRHRGKAEPSGVRGGRKRMGLRTAKP